MKCPLQLMGQYVIILSNLGSACECLKEECAWWGNTSQQCAIPRLANELYSLVEVMEEIRDYSPSELRK